MTTPSESPNAVSPRKVINKVASAIPEDCKQYVVVIGSLAAGYRFFGDDEKLLVQTKDIDCLLRPRVHAVAAGKKLTEQLMESGWLYHATEEFPRPGTPETKDEKLPVVRLAPPGEETWFIELLTVPDDEVNFKKSFIPLDTARGRFSLCSLGGISLTQWDPIETEFGIAIARPEMMAMANLLHHPKIGDEPMSGSIAGRSIKRSNKDLGRVLALAYLEEHKEEDSLLKWPENWRRALGEHFPQTWQSLAAKCGDGIRALLASRNDLEEAHHTWQAGLMAARQSTIDILKVTGERLLADAIEPLEKMAH